MRRTAALLALVPVLGLPGTAFADHDPPGFTPLPLRSAEINQGGVEGVEFSLVESFLTGNRHTDIDFFSRDGVTYVAAGTLGGGVNNAGQNIFRLTDEQGRVTPEAIEYVTGHPSATCVTNEADALGLQHDVEATPKGADVPIQHNLTDNEEAVTGDTQLLLDATDAPGRCHDQGAAGLADVPQGGLEIIDVTDVENPVEIGLTSHIGEAHTVNVDPRRPHIAYVVSSDRVAVNAEGERANETTATDSNLDGFEIVDLSSCMTAPFGTMQEGLTVEQKREACRPEVWRYRYPSAEMALGHTNQNAIYGCHELETWPEDVITCGGGAAMIVLDMSAVFVEGADGFERPQGDPMPCRVRESTSQGPTATTAMVTDCVTGIEGADLRVASWIGLGSPGSVADHVEHLGTAHHQGRQSATGDVTSPAFGSEEDIDFDHEAEYTHSRKHVLATDERGGGVLPPGAACAEGLDNPVGNGGVHAYQTDSLFLTGEGDQVPEPTEAFTSYALTPEGEKAIFRADVNTGGTPTECTAHVFQQLPQEGDGSMGRIFMGWYSQGTQVVDYRENADGTFEFASVGYFIPELANQWVSHVFSCEVQDDGRITYYGVASDFQLVNGRNAVEVFSATLPPLGSAFEEPTPVSSAPSFCTTAASSEQPAPTGGDGGGSTAPVTQARSLPATGADLTLIALAAVLLPAAVGVRVLRRRLS